MLLFLNSDDGIVEWVSCTRDVWRARKERKSCSRRRRERARLSESSYTTHSTSYFRSPKHFLLPVTKPFTCFMMLMMMLGILLEIFLKYLRIQVFLSVNSFIPAGHTHLTLEGLYKHRWLQPPLLPWQSFEPTSWRSAHIRWVHVCL